MTDKRQLDQTVEIPIYKFFLTFGSGSGFSDNYIVIEVHTENKDEACGHARKVAFKHFSDKWAMLYTEEEYEGQGERYGLHELAN